MQEGVHSNRIWVTGNTVIDALYAIVGRIKHNEVLQPSLKKVLDRAGYDVDRLSNENSFRRLVLITGHRRENFGEEFLQICHAIKMLSETYPDVDFVYPMHLNPNVRKPIKKIFNGISQENLFFLLNRWIIFHSYT